MKAQWISCFLTFIAMSSAAPLASASDSSRDEASDFAFPVQSCTGKLGKDEVTFSLEGDRSDGMAYLELTRRDQEEYFLRFMTELKLHRSNPRTGVRTYTFQSISPIQDCVILRERHTALGKALATLGWAITDLGDDVENFLRRKVQFRLRIHTDGKDVWFTRDGKRLDFRCQ